MYKVVKNIPPTNLVTLNQVNENFNYCYITNNSNDVYLLHKVCTIQRDNVWAWVDLTNPQCHANGTHLSHSTAIETILDNQGTIFEFNSYKEMIQHLYSILK